MTLQRFNAVDEQHTAAKLEEDAAYTANNIANAISALLLLDAPETSAVMDMVYRVLIAQATMPPPLDEIPW